MSHETPTSTTLEHKSSGQRPKSERIALALATFAGVAGLGHLAGEAVTPDFHGEHSVTITEDTVTDIAKDHVKGAENHIQATVREIVDRNPKVFQDGKAFVESEDLGKTIEVPKSVD